MPRNRLKPTVVLVADRTLSADYTVLFEGIFATMQTTKVPETMMKHLLSPAAELDEQGRARTAPIGLRRVEASLLRDTSLDRTDVVCTTPEGLESLIGPWVEVVMFSSSDPLGLGMSNTTTTNFWAGELYTRYWTRNMLTRLRELKRAHDFHLVAGGAGAWQFNATPQQRRKLGIDLLFQGYFESNGPRVIQDIIDGKELQDHSESGTCTEDIPPISDASTMGVIELSRGCGRGCTFCTMSDKKMQHLDPHTIVSDLKTNRDAGVRSVVSSSEDFFRYGSSGASVNFNRLRDLLRRMKAVEGLSFMQIDHGNISSVLQFSDRQLRELRDLLRWERATDYLWVNMGVESANGQLVHSNCPGKMAHLDPDNWEDNVRETCDKMLRCDFFPVFSVILGMPGETEEDVVRTRALVEDLGEKGAVVFPIFHEPISTGDSRDEQRFTLDDMTTEHLKLYRTCYELNFRKIPDLYWDNQRAGGVPTGRRTLLRALGQLEVLSWRRAFRQTARKINE